MSLALGIAIGVGAAAGLAYIAAEFAVRSFERVWKDWG